MLDRKSLTEAINQSAEGVVITGVQGVIRHVNPACAGLTGYRANVLLHRDNQDGQEENHVAFA
jgi:PAS domain S-box-containing protein